MKSVHTPFKKRISSWTNPWIIGIGIGLQLLGLPMVLWLMTYHSDAAVAMFVITWLSLTVFVLIMAKRTLLDPNYFVDRTIINRTHHEIHTHRRQTKEEFLKNEIDLLRQGQRTPVLDVWRLDGSLAKRHPYFGAAEAIIIDPGTRELYIRIQIGEFDESEKGIERFRGVLFKHIAEYMTIVASDDYAEMLRSYFSTVVLQIDSLKEDDRHVDIPYPILSLVTQASAIWSISTSPVVDPRNWIRTMDVRFDDGKEVEAHRVIELPAAHT